VDVAYVGTLGPPPAGKKESELHPSGTTLQPAAQDPSNPGNVLATQYLRPYIGYNDILFYNYDSNSSYHSLQPLCGARLARDCRRPVVDVVKSDGLRR